VLKCACERIHGRGSRRVAIKRPKKTAAEQIAEQEARRAFNPVAKRQSIAEEQSTSEFQENRERLRAERLARESTPDDK
jgi:hypothetical protein